MNCVAIFCRVRVYSRKGPADARNMRCCLRRWRVAAGVPTRFVIGVVYHDGIWSGHMWNEVCLGDWKPVDATVGGYVVASMHLKLIDSATVDGAMVVPKRILDRLQVEILDFSPH
jgi:hypothetical protein